MRVKGFAIHIFVLMCSGNGSLGFKTEIYFYFDNFIKTDYKQTMQSFRSIYYSNDRVGTQRDRRVDLLVAGHAHCAAGPLPVRPGSSQRCRSPATDVHLDRFVIYFETTTLKYNQNY